MGWIFSHRSIVGFGIVLLALGAATLGWLVVGRAPESAAKVQLQWFEDVTESKGISFVHDPGPLSDYFMPRALGAGAALFDFDRDGRLDILLLQSAGPDSPGGDPPFPPLAKGGKGGVRLYRQLPNGNFRDVTQGSGLDCPGYNTGVAIGDVNNDGWPDVAIAQYRGVRLFLNNGNGTFRDITQESQLRNPGWATSLAFVDYDRDGWLDLVVVNYVDYDPAIRCTDEASRQTEFCPPFRFPGSVTRLFHNLGCRRGDPPFPPLAKGGKGGVRFEDVTVSSNLGREPGPGLGVICADFDGDGWPDIFVANDGRANHLWINRRDGTFTNEAALRGVAFNMLGQPQANMGVALGDVDGDGLFDLFVTHLLEEKHTLWKQGPRGLFQDWTGKSALAAQQPGTGFGTVLADFDLDGHLDLAIVNGGIHRGRHNANERLPAGWGWYAERHQVFQNDGRGLFRDIARLNPALCGRPEVGRGLAVGDIDNDGKLDLLVTSVAGPARLLRNVAPTDGHWLSVRALLPSPLDPADPTLDRDAYGAQVTVRVATRHWLRLINPAESYQCSSDPRAHFGLGAARQVDAIEIQWPNGTRESFPGVPTNQALQLRQGQGQKVTSP